MGTKTLGSMLSIHDAACMFVGELFANGGSMTTAEVYGENRTDGGEGWVERMGLPHAPMDAVREGWVTWDNQVFKLAQKDA